jgi:hypothetical protein
VIRPHPLVAGLLLAVLASVLAGCGSGSANNSVAITPIKTIHLADFRPARPVRAGTPTTISFRIIQASGQTMTRFRTGSGPHTGVHLIIVRDDLGVIIHRHPPIGPGGVFNQQVTFPAPGPYRVVLDVYPALDRRRAELSADELPALRHGQGRRRLQAAGAPEAGTRRHR